MTISPHAHKKRNILTKYRDYTDQDIINAVQSSESYAQVLKKLNLVCAGGNYANLQRNIDRLKLDTSHMLREAINRGKELVSFEELTSPIAIKKRLIKQHGPSCQSCGLHTWMDVLIPLELDHIDGNNRNNGRDNLRLLCPNCHALTPTYRNRTR